jgi:hypothetical protein
VQRPRFSKKTDPTVVQGGLVRDVYDTLPCVVMPNLW